MLGSAVQRPPTRLLVALLWSLTWSAPAAAIVVDGLLTDLADSVPGQDRWRATFFVSDWTGYGPGYGFAIRIPLAQTGYQQIDSPLGGGDWTVVLHTRDPAIPADGALDARTLSATPDLGPAFSYEFVWDGGQGAPSLPATVDVYDDSFVVIESTAVPEPGVGVGLVAGAGALAGLARARRRRRARGGQESGRSYPAASRSASIPPAILLAALLVPLIGAGAARAQSTHVVLVGDYNVSFFLDVSAPIRTSQTTTDYVIQATALNLGTDTRPFQLIVSANSPTLAVVSGSLVFDGLAQFQVGMAEGTVVRLDRQALFDADDLQWTVEHPGDNTCTVNEDCATGYCESGYCCPSGDCCGMDSDCDAYDAASTCDDATSCQGTRLEGVCTGQSQCQAQVLDDDSGCMGLVSSVCDPYTPALCNGMIDQVAPFCETSCVDSGDCAPGATCLGDQCVFGLPAGEACTLTSECASGLTCVDGVCCTSTCSGTCQSCAVSGSAGTCVPVPTGQDPDGECGTISCAGYFFGWSGNDCLRRADVPALAATCNGSGQCVDPASACASSGAGTIVASCDATCQAPDPATCTGTTLGACLDVDQGSATCGAGVCQVTEPVCIAGRPNACTPDFGAAGPEVCNQLDDDCDGVVDDGAFQDTFEPNETCAAYANVPPVGSNQVITLTSQTVYGSGDNDYYRIVANESDSSCSCCDLFCTDEDYQLRITLSVPSGAGSYILCTGASCGSVGQYCTEILAGQSNSWIWTLDGACPANDSYEYFVRIYGDNSPASSCLPYTLQYQFTPGCF